jgi:hypothetical protein
MNQVTHGKEDACEIGEEKRLLVEWDGRIRPEYHLTEPVRMVAKEKEHYLNMIHSVMRGAKKVLGGTEVVYVGLFSITYQPLLCSSGTYEDGRCVGYAHSKERV